MPEDEIAHLLSEAEKRLDAARRLLDEGFYDDAVSRAYYSMYFAAVALFLTRNITVKTHKGLIAKFGQEFVDKGLIERYYGRALRIAEELRSEADYSISREIFPDEARKTVDDAENFLCRLKKAFWQSRKWKSHKMNTISIVCYLAAVLLLAAGTLAEPSMKLDGSAGKLILAQLTDQGQNQSDQIDQTNETENQSKNQTQEGLWSWGGVPTGYTLNQSSGKLEPVPTGEADWLANV